MKINAIKAFPLYNLNFNFKKAGNPLSTPAFDVVEFKGRPPKEWEPFYVVKIDGSRIAKFSNPTDAARKMKLERAGVVNCLEGNCNRTSDCFAFYAHEVDDEEGYIDGEKLAAAIRTRKDKLPQDQPCYVVSITDKKDYKRYGSMLEAAKGLGVAKESVSSCLKGKIKMTAGHFVIAAQEVEVKDEEGNLALDPEKYAKAYETRLEIYKDNKKRVDVPIYTVRVGEKDTLRRFSDINKAAGVISTSRDNLMNALKGKVKKTNGHFVFDVSLIDMKDKEGNPIYDKEGKPIPDMEKFDRLYDEKMASLDIHPKKLN